MRRGSRSPDSSPTTDLPAFSWAYTTDLGGNVTQIHDGTTPRTYSYFDNLYFLKQGDGPWGPRAWTYDRIGNRLTESRGSATDTYNYTGHNPRLNSITLAGSAGARSYIYDLAGNQIQAASPTSQQILRYDGANRLVQIQEESDRTATYLTYDGRSFLTQARQDINACSPVVTQSHYSSEGLLLGRATKNILTATPTKDTKVLYFAGRPVGLPRAYGRREKHRPGLPRARFE